uniref:Neurotransmitter-gated ion-channel transmembrane domain-containing protein n=1 Tax=Anopheles atroparvus TaxID=41427 RepID=A0A182J5Q7_ANOAO
MAEEVLLGVEQLVVAHHLEQGGELRFGADPRHVQLIARQQNRHAEGLFERRVRHHGQLYDPIVVVTRGLQPSPQRPAHLHQVAAPSEELHEAVLHEEEKSVFSTPKKYVPRRPKWLIQFRHLAPLIFTVINIIIIIMTIISVFVRSFPTRKERCGTRPD